MSLLNLHVTDKQRDVLKILLVYYLDCESGTFTYDSLRRWYFRRGLRFYRVPYVRWHTVERYVRDFKSLGLLEHVRVRPVGKFTVTRLFFDVVIELFRLIPTDLHSPEGRSILRRRLLKGGDGVSV